MKATFYLCPDCGLYYEEDDGREPGDGCTLEDVVRSLGSDGWEQSPDRACGCQPVLAKMERAGAPEVRKFLTVSMAHLPESFADRKLQHCFDPTGDAAFCGSYGTVIYAPSVEDMTDEVYIAAQVENDTPESVAKLLLYARKELGCSYVLFDRDGDEREGFATYEGDETEEAEAEYRNYYKCYRCKHGWTDVWTAQCDDDCPKCGARHCSPYKSEDV